ncbi:hypothetical protein [Shewanella sp. YIC-542]|uniref:hypothetical protein n=1 Tax=Shewanella mytili TaxID=3377111 RepID=UPI00398F22A4
MTHDTRDNAIPHEGTPRDYSEQTYRFYFEVGEFQGKALGIISAFVGSHHAKRIVTLPFGYELDLPIQCVPDIAKLLSMQNIAIYQIVKYEKTDTQWR